MAQYNRIPIEIVEHTELARKSYRDYEYSMVAPNEAEVEAEWIAKRKMLRDALDTLTPRQREVFTLKVAYLMPEIEIAKKLGISQSAVCQFFYAAEKKLMKFTGKITID